MKYRKAKEKPNCIYCGQSASTFCGYWKLISVDNYDNGKKGRLIDTCYAHIGCYIGRNERIIQLGVNPLTVHNQEIRTIKQAMPLFKIHGDIRRVKRTIRFLQRFVKLYESSKLKQNPTS